METINVYFDKSDLEMYGLIKNEFGEEIKFKSIKAFDGLNVLIVAAIPVLALSIQTMDFFLTHFKKEDKTERKIEMMNGKVSLINYSVDDAKKILETLFDHEKS